MEEKATKENEILSAFAAYRAASEGLLQSTKRLNEAWMLHFEQNAVAPSQEWIAEVAALQMASDLALGQARSVTEIRVLDRALDEVPETGSAEPAGHRTRRKRRRENKFLARIGRPGQRLLRAVLLILLLLSALVAGSAGISLALEIAGILRLIDEPVQLPVGIQLVTFVAAAGVVFGLKRALEAVERALYGSKSIRPKRYQL